MSRVMGCLAWRMTGCIREYDILECLCRPPTLNKPSESRMGERGNKQFPFDKVCLI